MPTRIQLGEAEMKPREDQNFPIMAILVTFGVLSTLGVTFAIYLNALRRQADPFFASGELRTFQERNAVTDIRRGVAEDFASAVVNCLSPPILPGESLTERQITERVTAAIERTFSSAKNIDDPRCHNSKSTHWTFEPPCRLKISESFSKVTGGLNLGEIGICNSAIVASVLRATRTCPDSAEFTACLARSIVANDEIKNEIEKPVENQHGNNQQ
jgi:hypothetical protein